VEEFINALAQYEERAEQPSLMGFLEEASLAARDENDDDTPKLHALTLMTLHSAKGLEFPHVYLVGMEEGLLPHKRSVSDGGANIAEERRLCYVGVTRAQNALTLSFCSARMKWGKMVPCLPSRFLMEMRGETERARGIAERSKELLAPKPAPAAAKRRAKKVGRKKAKTLRSRS
jgi:DNA helicase-2/ATP-dependent DNA helicase PcrA